MTIPLTIKQIEMLVKISEGKGLSEAARLLNLSPSAVSKGLAVMEENLGVPLIQRTTRSFQLTEAGEYFVSRASDLLKEFDDIVNTTCGYFNHPHGALKITCSVAFGYAHLIDIFEEYRKKNHDVELILDLDDHLTNLNENNVDIALRITATPPQNYAARKLSKISWLYCASPDYLARKGSPTKRTELASHECLIYPGLTPALRYNDIASPHPQCAIKPRTPVQANSSLLLLKAALSGQGIAWLPSYLISQHIDAGALVPLKLDGKYAYPTHSLYALYFPSKFRNPKVRSFIDFLVEENQLRELQNLDFIWLPRTAAPAWHDRLIHCFYDAGFTPRSVMHGVDAVSMLTLVSAGMGCTIVAEGMRHLAPSNVSFVVLEDLNIVQEWELVWRKDRCSEVLKSLINLI